MDTARRINELLDRWMIGVIMLCVATAVVVREHAAPWRIAAPYALGLLIMCLTINTAIEELRQAIRSVGAICLCTFVLFVVLPLCAWGLVQVGLRDVPDLAMGLILFSALPSATLAAVWTYLSRGQTGFSLTITFITTLAAPLVTPAVLRAFGGSLVEVDALRLLYGLMLMLVLPTLVGVAIRRKAEEAVLRLRAVTGLATKALIIYLIVVNIAPAIPYLVGMGPKLPAVVGLSAVQVCLGFALGLAAGKILRRPELMSSVTFSCALRNTGLGLVLAQLYFHPLTVTPIVVAILTHHPLASIAQRYFLGRSEELAAGQSAARAPCPAEAKNPRR